MGNLGFLNETIDRQLKDLHCGYIGKVISTDGKTATVQPLGLVKQYGGAAKKQAVVSNVPIACHYKIQKKTIEYTDGSGAIKTQDIAVPAPLSAGDLVACLCADRDITAARRGSNELPTEGMHSITDSIIVGIL